MVQRNKRSLLVGVILAQVALVLVFSVFMRPVREGTSEDFWWCACRVDLDGRDRDVFAGFYQPRDGWYIYYEQGIHGQFLYRLPRSEVLADYPEVLRRMVDAASHEDASPGLCRVREQLEKNRDVVEQNPDELLALICNVRLELLKQEDDGGYDYCLSAEEDFAERWRRIQRYWLNVVFECVFFSGLTVFALWPWLRGKGRTARSIHFGLTPFLLLLPYFLGYATWTFTSAGPSGGVFYPFAILPFRVVRFLGHIDQWCWEAFPKILEPLSQLLGPMLAVTGFGAPGPASAVMFGTVVAAITWTALRLRERSKTTCQSHQP